MVSSPRARKSLSAAELDRFLAYLARTGNFALSCDWLGRGKAGLYKRRKRDPEFDARCREAIAAANAWSWRTGGVVRRRADDGRSETVLGTYAGRRQLRRVPPGTMTRAGEEAFLMKLSETGNIRFAAHAIGLAASSIHARRRRDPVFAGRLKQALSAAQDLLELRFIEASGAIADGLTITAALALRYLEAARREERGLDMDGEPAPVAEIPSSLRPPPEPPDLQHPGLDARPEPPPRPMPRVRWL